MNTYLTMIRVVWLSSVMLMLMGSVLPTRAEDRLVEGAMILAPGHDRMGEIWEDTLKACLARIPEQVTPEQRMMAQQQCHKEETMRKLEPLAAGKED